MKNNKLTDLRNEIDAIDTQIIKLIAMRFAVVKKIGIFKKANNIPVLDEERWQTVIRNRLNQAKILGLSEKLIKKIYEEIHKYSLLTEK